VEGAPLLVALAGPSARGAIPEPWVRQAQLTIRTGDRAVDQVAGGVLRRGHEMIFEVEVTTDQGTRYQAACARFVAPHDPAIESRSVSPAT
jgi:hypothetical protein